MKNNYLIVCNSRSGSHLLCTLLNSHSTIACVGETDEIIDELKNARGEKTGRIIFNRQFLRFSDRYKSNNIIHLTRDSQKIAISKYIFNHTNDRPRHFTKLANIHSKLDKRDIEQEAIIIKNEEQRIREILKSYNSIEISYEEMTNNKNIKKLNKETTKKLLDFLAVEYETLITKLVKPRQIII